MLEFMFVTSTAIEVEDHETVVEARKKLQTYLDNSDSQGNEADWLVDDITEMGKD